MLAFAEEHYGIILLITAIIVLVIFTLCLIGKMFKIAVGLALLSIIIPILFTIFWGDGSEYVSRFASLFEPAHQQQIEDAYQFYKDKDAEDPFVDYDAVSESVTNVFRDVEEYVSERAPSAVNSLWDLLNPGDASEANTGGG